jgi:hypothetical protein
MKQKREENITHRIHVTQARLLRETLFSCCSYRSSLTKFFCTFQPRSFKFIFLSDVFRLRLIKNINMITHKCTTTKYLTHKRASLIIILYPFVGALKQNVCDVCNIYIIVFYIHFIQYTIKMFSLLHITVLVSIIHGVSTIKCYQFIPGFGGNGTIGTYDTATSPGLCNATVVCVCTSYRFQCTSDNTACSTSQIQNNATIWIYSIMTNDSCATLPAAGAMSVTCCYTDLCNNQGMSNTSPTILPCLSTWITLLALCFVLRYS